MISPPSFSPVGNLFHQPIDTSPILCNYKSQRRCDLSIQPSTNIIDILFWGAFGESHSLSLTKKGVPPFANRLWRTRAFGPAPVAFALCSPNSHVGAINPIMIWFLAWPPRSGRFANLSSPAPTSSLNCSPTRKFNLKSTTTVCVSMSRSRVIIRLCYTGLDSIITRTV